MRVMAGLLGGIGAIGGSLGSTLSIFGSILLILAAWVVPAMFPDYLNTSAAGPDRSFIVLGSIGAALGVLSGVGTAIAHPSEVNDQYRSRFADGWLEFAFFLIAGLWHEIGGAVVAKPRPYAGGTLMILSGTGTSIAAALIEPDLFAIIIWFQLVLVVAGVCTISGGLLRPTYASEQADFGE